MARPLIASDTTIWLARVNALSRLEPAAPTGLAELHSRLEQIHPFLGGDGRAGRLLLNLLLVRLGFRDDHLHAAARRTARLDGPRAAIEVSSTC